MFRFKKVYFLVAVLIFFIEVIIAIFVNDRFIRPYFGDVLVVILIYCFFKSFLEIRPVPLGMFVLLFAFCVEALQYFNLIELIGLCDNKIARVVLGSSFAWMDLVSYTAGIAIVLLADIVISPKSKEENIQQ